MYTLNIFKILVYWISICHFNNFPNRKGQSYCDTVGLTVNIKNKGGTYGYGYNYYGNAGTYTARVGCSIVVVKQGNTVIWRAKHETEYAYHVRVDGLGSPNKTVTVFHSNGEKSKFLKVPGFCGFLSVWVKERVRPIYRVGDRVILEEVKGREERVSGDCLKGLGDDVMN